MINSINMKVFTGCPCVPGRGTPWGHSCVRLPDTPLSQWGLTTCTYAGLAGDPDPCVWGGQRRRGWRGQEWFSTSSPGLAFWKNDSLA